MSGRAVDEEDALEFLRAQAARVGVWISGPNPNPNPLLAEDMTEDQMRDYLDNVSTGEDSQTTEEGREAQEAVMEGSHEGQDITEEMAEADRRSRELDRRMPEAEAAPMVLFYGPDIEIQVVEVVNMEMLRVFLAQYGEGHLTEDRAWQEQEHVDLSGSGGSGSASTTTSSE